MLFLFPGDQQNLRNHQTVWQIFTLRGIVIFHELHELSGITKDEEGVEDKETPMNVWSHFCWEEEDEQPWSSLHFSPKDAGRSVKCKPFRASGWPRSGTTPEAANGSLKKQINECLEQIDPGNYELGAISSAGLVMKIMGTCWMPYLRP